MSASPPYEPEVIERFAARLDARARTIQRGFVVAGAAVGGLFGSMPLTPLGEVWPIPSGFGFATFLLGVIAGGLTGYVIGAGRAELERLHAQTVLCQLHAQRATLAIWRLLREREAGPAPVVAPPASVPPRAEPPRAEPQRLVEAPPPPPVAPRAPVPVSAPPLTPLAPAAPVAPAPEPLEPVAPAADDDSLAPPLTAPAPLRSASAPAPAVPPVSPRVSA